MKKLSLLIVAALFAVSAGFVSCSSDDEDPLLDISFANSENSTTLAAGKTSYEVNATITSTAGLKEVKWFLVTGTGASLDEEQLGIETSFKDKNRYDFKQAFNAYDETVIKISATDKDNVTQSKSFTIKVTKETPVADATISIWPDRVLGAQNNANGSSCASVDGIVYTQKNAIANITKVDFIYFYQTGGKLSELVSPATANLSWLPASGKNATKFTAPLDITDTQYNSITETVGQELIDEKVTDNTATLDFAEKLAGNKYIGFKTAGGKTGILKVVKIDGTDAGTMTIDIKVKK